MVNLKRLSKQLEERKKEKEKEKYFIPSKLSPSKKKYVKYELSQDIKNISKQKSEIDKKIKEQEQRKKNLNKKLGKLARKKVVSKRILKPSKTTLNIKQREVQSIFNDPNRFFKNEMEEARNSLFFK